MTKQETARTHACPIRNKLTSPWIPEKQELRHLILPSDPRYYEYGACGSQVLTEEKKRITDLLFELVQSDIIRLMPQEIPAKVPEHIPRYILRALADSNNIPREHETWWIDGVDRASADWCHHDPETGYLVAKLLCVTFKSRLLRGWRVVGAPGYNTGGIADLGLTNPKGECIIAIEIGDTYPRKFVEGFYDTKFRQLWYFPYYHLLSGRHYQWERKGVYFVWTRGLRWGESFPYIDRL